VVEVSRLLARRRETFKLAFDDQKIGAQLAKIAKTDVALILWFRTAPTVSGTGSACLASK